MLKECHEWAKQLSAYAWRFGDAETDGAPLKSPPRLRVAKSAILLMGRMKAKGQVCVLEINQHAVVTWLYILCYELIIIHLKNSFPLETIESSIVRAQAVIAILFGYGENWGFKIPKREPLGPSKNLMLPTSFIIQ